MKLQYLIFSVLIFIFGVLLIIFPSIGSEGVAYGIILCGKVIIPSLFPFTMCVLFIMNTKILNYLEFISPITEKIFKLNFYEFVVFVISLIGGYPIGAKLINESVKKGEISDKKASIMINFCVNAGPAFIITAIGNGIFHSKKIGLVLFLSHISSSVIICLFANKKENNKLNIKTLPNLSLADNFVYSATSASSTLISICSFVILFSALNSYLIFFGEKFPFFKYIAMLLEITNSLTYVKNIYLVSFLLGFSGISIWCQVKSALNNVNINYIRFIFFRIFHGALGSFLTYCIVKVFKITIPATSSAVSYKLLFSTPALSISLVILAIVFAISVPKNDKLLQKNN